MTITVSTDGSALGNPNGPMGWGWADHELATGGKPGHHHEGDCDAGGATNGTNQIGELCAVLEALRAHPGSEPLVIETDSQYAINCSTTWVHGWKKNGWKNSQKKPVKNADLIRAIDAEISKRPGPVNIYVVIVSFSPPYILKYKKEVIQITCITSYAQLHTFLSFH